MKQFRSVMLIVLIMVGCVLGADVESDQKASALSSEENRFDLNRDGELSAEEDGLMFRVTSLEALIGDTLSSEEIARMEVTGQPEGGFGGRGRGRGPRLAEKLVERFDKDSDGKLTGAERQAALDAREGGTATLLSASRLNEGVQNDVQASLTSVPEGSPLLYDAETVRTLYLRFHHEDWYQQMNAFYRTDIEVPAELIVDGEVYSDVGVHFRGTSSYFTVDSEKKSFNIAVDYGEAGQRLYGYKTLNLLNGHVDASFLREVLYNRISRAYMPAMKTNFVKLVVNGENWGVYINLQQYNKDFLAEWFGTKGGVRWKVGPGSGGALNYNGEDPAAYRETYQLKTRNVEDPWSGLIALCRMLSDETSDEVLVQGLPSLLNVDQVLWQLAVSNVFMDDDGYIHKGGDYAIYQDVKGRFHLIPHDNNESIRFARGGRGGPGGRGGRGGPGNWSWGELTDGMISPVTHEGDSARPLIKRLLSHPEWRARYLAHVRTVVDEWLDWEVLGPVVEGYMALIDADVEKDDKKLYGYEEFAGQALPGLRDFITRRREYLLGHPELNRPTLKILSVAVEPETAPIADTSVRVRAVLDESVGVDSVLLHYSAQRYSVFNRVRMTQLSDKSFVGTIPAFSAGTLVYYYVEANAVGTHGTSVFSPVRAELGAAQYRARVPMAVKGPVVINELMAANTGSVTDPQGQYEDWLELYNVTDAVVSLSGMYLTDKMDNPKKWAFPEGTAIPARGYLLVWLDEDGRAEAGLHANFKLSRGGETVALIDSDTRGNQVLDSVTFEKQEADVALGRWPNGSGELRRVETTPGKENRYR